MSVFHSSSTQLALLIARLLLAQASIPGAPLNLHVAFVTRLEVALIWDPSPNAVKYKMQYKESACSACPMLSFGPGAEFSETSMRIGNLKQNTIYDVNVFAGNANGWSQPASLISQAAVQAVEAPQPPTGLREQSHDPTSITLAWDAPVNPAATNYQVYFSQCEKQIGQANCSSKDPCLSDRTVKCGDYELYQNGLGGEWSVTQATIANLLEGHVYFFYVQARNLNINGYENGGSLPIQLIPRMRYSTSVINLQLIGVTTDTVQLRWTAAQGAVEYKIQWRIPTIGNSWTKNTASTSTQITITGLSTNVNYDFRVLARDLFQQVGTSGFVWAGDLSGTDLLDQSGSNLVSATPVLPLQTIPTNLVVSGFSDTEIHLQWATVDGAAYYQVQYKKVDTAYLPLDSWKDFGSQPTRFYTNYAAVTELLTGVQYELRINAFNYHVIDANYKGYAGPSNSVIGTPSAKLPAPASFSLVTHSGITMQQCIPLPCILQAATPSIVTLDPRASSLAQVYAGSVLVMLNGSAADSVRSITSYNGSSRMAVLSNPFIITPGSGSAYRIDRYALGSDRATLIWTRVAGAQRYLLSQRTAYVFESFTLSATIGSYGMQNGSCYRTLPEGNQNPSLLSQETVCYEVSGLVVGQTYEFVIAGANDHLSPGFPSQSAFITPTVQPDGNPLNGQAVNQDEQSVTFTWDGPRVSAAPTLFYKIQFLGFNSSNVDPRTLREDQWTTAALQYVYSDSSPGYYISGLTRASGYFFRIYSGNFAGFSYPPLLLVLPRQVYDLQVKGAASTNCVLATCSYSQVSLGWKAPALANYFKIQARAANYDSQAAYLDVADGIVVNTTSVILNNADFPAALPLQVSSLITYRVLAANSVSGPFEQIGTTVTVACQNQRPASPSQVRMITKSKTAFSLVWQPSSQLPSADYFVVWTCDFSSCSYYPNVTIGNKVLAKKFLTPQALIDKIRGNSLQVNVQYNVTVFACSYFDENLDGILTGDEGCETAGSNMPYAVIPGDIPPAISGLRVVEVEKAMFKLQWPRPGALASLATSYRIWQRVGSSSPFIPANRVIVRGNINPCNGSNPLCYQLFNITYGLSNAPDTCGLEFCTPLLSGMSVYISYGIGQGQTRTIATAVNRTIFLSSAFDVSFALNQLNQSTVNVFSELDYGGLCCPVQDQNVVAYVAGLASDTWYQYTVFSANQHEDGFETIGSNIATGYTVGLPNPVIDLSVVNLVGTSQLHVRWTDPGGPKYCGTSYFQLYELVPPWNSWNILSSLGNIQPNSLNGAIGVVDVIATGSPAPNVSTGGLGQVNFYMAKTFCSVELGAVLGVTYLDSTDRASIMGNIVPAVLQAPPSGTMGKPRVLMCAESSILVAWDLVYRAKIYKVQVLELSQISPGPWANFSNLSVPTSYVDWPSAQNPQFFRTNQANLTGLSLTRIYKIRVLAGSFHNQSNGSFPVVSSETSWYSPLKAPVDSDIRFSLTQFTTTSMTFQLSSNPSTSIDPADHSQPMFVLSNRITGSTLWNGGRYTFLTSILSLGCTNVEIEQGQNVGRLPGCGPFILTDVTNGISTFRYTYSGLPAGQTNDIKIQSFSIYSSITKSTVYTGLAARCACIVPSITIINTEGQVFYFSAGQLQTTCSSLFLASTNISCTLNTSLLYLQAPASTHSGAYDGLKVFVRSGTGVGQERQITAYIGGSSRLAVIDYPWNLIPDDSSTIEIGYPGYVAVGSISNLTCSFGSNCSVIATNSSRLVVGEGLFLFFRDGSCAGQLRRIVANGTTNTSSPGVLFVGLYPPITCGPQAGDRFVVYNYSFGSKIVGSITQVGPPVQISQPVILSITYNSVTLEWDPVSQCVTGASGVQATTPCNASVYLIQARQTHDSSDFPTQSANWSLQLYSSVPYAMISGLYDMASFEFRVSAKRALSDDFGNWSASLFVKLTSGVPTFVPQAIPVNTSLYNDRISLSWTCDTNPRQSDRFFVQYGQTSNSLSDYGTVVNGVFQRFVFGDSLFCTDYLTNKILCQTYVTGLHLGTIYFFKVYSGNRNGFESTGSNLAVSATLSLPTSPVQNFMVIGIIRSGNLSGYGATLSWTRPAGWPTVTKYYIAWSISDGPVINSTIVIRSLNSSVLYNVTGLTKSTQYGFQVHCGNRDGPIGFHPSMYDDPTTSPLITVVPDDAPGPPWLKSASPSIPDQNTMMQLSWLPPQTGGAVVYYIIGFCIPSAGTLCTPVTYTGCRATDPFCATNAACNPVLRLCLAPCMGATNEGTLSQGQPCQFNSLSGLVIGLLSNTLYQFNISAVNNAGQGGWSSLDNVQNRTLSLPSAVTGLNISDVQQFSVTLRWYAQNCMSCFFKITWYPSILGVSQAVITGIQMYVHTVDFTAGSVGITYRVYAGYSPSQFEISGSTVYLPKAASNFNIISAVSSSLTFQWSPDPSSDTFQVWMARSDSSPLSFHAVSDETHSNSAIVEGLRTGFPYIFKVFSKISGQTPFEYFGSNTITAVVSGTSSPPTNLQVVMTTSSQVQLSWEPPTIGTIIGYKIVRASSGTGLFAYPIDVVLAVGGSTQVMVTDLLGAQQYDFKVFAASFEGFETVGSNVVSQIQPVATPRSLSVRGVSDKTLTLEWYPPESALSPQAYRIQILLGGATTRMADVAHFGGENTLQSAMVTSLVPALYQFTAFSKGSLGYYEPFGSNILTAAPMLAPFNLRVSSVATYTVSLAWNVPPTPGFAALLIPISYVLAFTRLSTGFTYYVANISAQLSNYSISDLYTNERYLFVITGVNSDGLQFTTLGSDSVLATPMDSPSQLDMIQVNAGSVTLSWMSPSKGVIPASYQIQIVDTVYGTSNSTQQVPHVGGFYIAQVYTVTGLSNGRQYRFNVAAQSAFGDYSDASNSITTTIISPPSSLHPVAVNSTSIVLAWVPPVIVAGLDSPTGYVITYTDNLGTLKSTGILSITISATTIGSLQSGTSYLFCLRARASTGDFVNALGGCCRAVPVSEAQDLRIVDIDISSITLQWNSVSIGMIPFSYLVIYSCNARTQSVAVLSVSGQSQYQTRITNLSQFDICTFAVYSNLSSFVSPTSSNSVTSSPIGRANNTKLCYYQKTEVSLKWSAPFSSPIPKNYRISYRPVGCVQNWWQVCDNTAYSPDIEHRGGQLDLQSAIVMNIVENTMLEFRVHTKNEATNSYDPVGSSVVLATPRGDRSDYALDLSASNPGVVNSGYVLISAAGDISRSLPLQSGSVTLEAWINIKGALNPDGSPRYSGIAGNAYSFTTQAKQGAGHFGYGLFCIDLRCGFHIGTRTDLITSVRGLCQSLVFPQPGCGQIGWTTSHRALSSPLQPGIWYHIAGTYDQNSGAINLFLNGVMVYQEILYITSLNGEKYTHPSINYVGERTVYAAQGDTSAMMPWQRTDWQIGRLLMGVVAQTVETAPFAFFQGVIDEVRVWSYAKAANSIMQSSVLDTVAPGTPGLLGYWAFDDPVHYLQCADDFSTVRDASAVYGSGLLGHLNGVLSLIVSDVPLDYRAEFNGSISTNNSNYVLHVGHAIQLSFMAFDRNPTDAVIVTYEVASRKNHPIGAMFRNATNTSAVFEWAPVQPDAGKNVSVCFTLVNLISNPKTPEFAGTAAPSVLCTFIFVPLCTYQARRGDSMRSIATSYGTNWRALYALNPELASPDLIAPGMVLRVGHFYTVGRAETIQALVEESAVTWDTFVNNNAALVNMLWTDQYFAGISSQNVTPITFYDPGMGIFDMSYMDLDRLRDYTGQQVCLVSPLSSNCI